MVAPLLDGFDLIGYDAAGTADRLPAGACAADSGEQVLTEAGVVLLSLPDGAVTRSVVDMIVAHDARTVETIVDLSTIGPRAAVEAAAALADVGVTYTDGPVSGGVSGGESGGGVRPRLFGRRGLRFVSWSTRRNDGRRSAGCRS